MNEIRIRWHVWTHKIDPRTCPNLNGGHNFHRGLCLGCKRRERWWRKW